MAKGTGKSINRRIKSTFVLAMIIMTISFLFSNSMKNNVVKQYEISMKINIELSDLSVNLDKSWVNFDSYIKTHEYDRYKDYEECNRKVESIIKEVAPYVNQDRESSMYLRSLTNMYELYKQQAYMIIASEKLDIETYEQYAKLGKINFYISQHSRNLTSLYLQYTNSSYTNKLETYKTLDTNLYLLLFMALVVNGFLIWVINHDIIKTLNKLSMSVKQLSDSNWSIPDIKGQTYKELDNLTKTFNHMKNSLRDYIAELNEKAEIEKNYHMEKIKSAEKDKLIKDTQLKSLQSQINPHFLFNNLNTVSRMAMFEGADRTVGLIGALSKILRYNLTSIDKLVSLREEILNVEAYVLIQKTKFEDRISFHFDIKEEIEDLEIPPMVIQLLVENAIIHGVSGLDRPGIIKIEAHKEDEYGVITVEDNGVGITKDYDKVKGNKNTTGLGLANIKKRLELYFNRYDLLVIQGKEGQGSKISIYIPLAGNPK